MSQRYEIGDRIARYFEVIDIKSGGMGVVYICIRQPRDISEMPGVVALKTFQDRILTSDATIRAFYREAEIWVKLGHHNHIVRAHGVIKVKERPYIVLEWISGHSQYGPSLRGWLSNGAVDLERALKWSIQSCQGLVYAHEQYKFQGHAFVHGDLKPENILISKDEMAKITDFGLTGVLLETPVTPDPSAPQDSDDLTISKRGSVGATPAYMSPEQFIPGNKIDVRSDIYSFGCVLYELISGKRPFEAPGSFFASDKFNYYQMRHTLAAPDDLRVTCENCPESVATIVMRCLQKKPAERYGSFSELLKDLATTHNQAGNADGAVSNTSPVSASEWIDRANAFMNLGHYSDAATFCAQALEIDPQNEKAWWLKAMALGNLRKFEEVLVCIANAERHRRVVTVEKLAECAVMKASALEGLERLDEAMPLFDEGLRLLPTYANGWYVKGLALLRASREDDALRAFQKAVEYKPDFFAAWTDAGLALWQLGCYPEAANCLRTALKIHPRYPLAWLHLGNTLGAMGEFQNALECFERALAIDPSLQEASEKRDKTLQLLANP